MTRWRHDIILIVVNKLTKVTHFIPRSLKDGLLALAKNFLQEVFRLHGVPEIIISDRDAMMTSRF